MDLRGASDYFKSRWKWRSEPEWYRELQARRIEAKRGATKSKFGTPVADEPQQQVPASKTVRDFAKAAAKKAVENALKTREKGAENNENSTTTHSDEKPSKNNSKAQARIQREQHVLNSYLQQVVEALDSLPANTSTKQVRTQALELRRAPQITPEKLLDFDRALDNLEKTDPKAAQTLKAKRNRGSAAERNVWDKVEDELKHLRDLEQKGESLQFSQNLAGTTMGVLEAFLGPAGPLLRVARELHAEYKDDAKGLLVKFGKLPKFITEKAETIHRAWARRGTEFARRFPKLAGALDKFGKRLKNLGGSLLDKLPRMRGKLGMAVGAAKAVGGFLGTDIGKAATLVGVGGLMSFFGKKTDKTDGPTGADGKPEKESAWSVNSIAEGLKSAATRVGGMFSELTNWMGNAWTSMTTWASSAWDGLVKGQQDAVLRARMAKDYIEEKRDVMWEAVTGWFSELWSKIKELIPESVKKGAAWAKQKAGAAVDAVKNTRVGGAVTGLVSKASKGVSDMLGGDGREKIGLLKNNNADDVAAGQKATKLGSGVDVANLNPGLMQNFYAMVGEYNRVTGRVVQVNSGARTKDQQAALRAANPGKAAPPGYSMHEYGLALDINSREANEMQQMGLLQKYGFVRPVGGEPWHLEPASIQGVKSAIRKGTADIDVAVAKPADKDTEGVTVTQKAKAADASATTATITAQPSAVTPSMNEKQGLAVAASVKPKSTDSANKQDGASTTSGAMQAMSSAVSAAGGQQEAGAALSMVPKTLQTAAQQMPGMSGSATPLANTVQSAIEPQLRAVSKMLGDAQSNAQTEGYQRVESQTREVDAMGTIVAGMPQAAQGNKGNSQIPTKKIGFYIGDMGFLTMNLGVGA